MGQVEDFVLLVKTRLSAVYGEIKKGRGLLAIIKAVFMVAPLIEEIVASGTKLTSEQKKEVAVRIINELVDIPFLWEGAEATLIGLFVDGIIAGFNVLYGKLWIKKVEVTP